MKLLIAGLVVFLGIHLLPLMPAVRTLFAGFLGENRYKGLFSIVAGLGLAMIVWGYAIAPRGEQLFAPSMLARELAPYAMALSFVLLAAANMRSHIRRTLKHPMLAGIGVWALTHLLANGHERATLLFAAFLAYVALDLGSVMARGSVKQFEPLRKHDVIAIGGGIGLALLVMLFHRIIFGVAPVAWSL